MSFAASRKTSPLARAWVLVALALAFAIHAVWTPVHLAVAHQFEVVLWSVGGQHAHVAHHADSGPGHHDHGRLHEEPQHEEPQHEHPGHGDHAGDHLISLLAVRALTNGGALQLLPLKEDAWVFRAPAGHLVEGPLALLAPRRPPPRPCTRGPPRAL